MDLKAWFKLGPLGNLNQVVKALAVANKSLELIGKELGLFVGCKRVGGLGDLAPRRPFCGQGVAGKNLQAAFPPARCPGHIDRADILSAADDSGGRRYPRCLSGAIQR